MKMKKYAIVSAAAMAMLCGSLTGVCYADNNTSSAETAVVSESSKKAEKLSGITDIKISGYENCTAYLISDEGQVYYAGSKNSKFYIFTADNNGNVTASAEFAGKSIGAIEFRQAGDNICVFYNEAIDIDMEFNDAGWYATPILPGGGMQDLYMVMFDKNLDQLGKYNITSYAKIRENQSVGVNSTKIVYARTAKKLYISDYDGSNKKLLLDLSKTDYSDLFINSIAMTEDYVALEISSFYTNDGKEGYCGLIDLKTGRLITEKHNSAISPMTAGDGIIWRSDSQSKSTATTLAELMEEQPNITTKTTGYVSGVEIVTFKDKKFRTIKTEKPVEALNLCNVIDSEGRVITYDKETFRIYKDGKCIQKIKLDPSKYYPEGATNTYTSLIAANDGVISVRYGYLLNKKMFNGGILLVPYDTEE